MSMGGLGVNLDCAQALLDSGARVRRGAKKEGKMKHSREIGCTGLIQFCALLQPISNFHRRGAQRSVLRE